jgi:hypothetical protein
VSQDSRSSDNTKNVCQAIDRNTQAIERLIAAVIEAGKRPGVGPPDTTDDTEIYDDATEGPG